MASSYTTSRLPCHERFYFSDGRLYLVVEDTIYCVHRYLFEKHASNFPFREIDASLSNPYTLRDVEKIDFDRFLACLYPRTLWVEEAKTTEEWSSILKLASKWGFDSLRSRAMRKIETLKNDLAEAKQEVSSIRKSIVEENQSFEHPLDEERKAKERARKQLDSRLEELQRRKSKFASLWRAASVQKSIVEEKQSFEHSLDEEREAKERARKQLDSRLEEIQRRKRKSIFACLWRRPC